MKFLLDQDVYALTRIFLAELGLDITTAGQLGFSHTPDHELLDEARRLNRILVTRDRDFGALVHSRQLGGGVICLRVLPTTVRSVHEELQRVLEHYSERDILGAFVVVEPGRHRFRRV